MERIGVGVVGCGNISDIYLSNLQDRFPQTEVVAVMDLDRSRAQQRAEEFNVRAVCPSVEEMVTSGEVSIVVNLTTPQQHVSVTRAALEGGKHVYVEKPLALSREAGRELVTLAKQKGLMLACAPDTFLGSGLQTAQKLVIDGWIGRPLGGIAHLLRSGPESWHPDPAFLYQLGGGPLWDSGPYFITALAYLLGPVERVMCSAKVTFAVRTVTSQVRFGEVITVEVPTLFGALLDFASGAMISLVMSVDVYSSRLQDPRQHDHAIELYGTEGTLSVPSPCYFDGQLYYRQNGRPSWAELPGLCAVQGNSRGVGVADMASALLNDRPPRLTPEMAYHTLDVLVSLDESWQTGRAVDVTSTYNPSEPMIVTGDPTGLGLL
jgi:predicted dehydrogenase